MLHVHVNLDQGSERARGGRRAIDNQAAALDGDRRLYCEQLHRRVVESIDATDVEAVAQAFLSYLDAAALLTYWMGIGLAVRDDPEAERADLLGVFARLERTIAELPIVPLDDDTNDR